MVGIGYRKPVAPVGGTSRPESRHRNAQSEGVPASVAAPSGRMRTISEVADPEGVAGVAGVALSLTDTQLGLMGGLAFALFYTLLGIPIAMSLVPELDLKATPELCRAAGAYLLKHARNMRLPPQVEPEGDLRYVRSPPVGQVHPHGGGRQEQEQRDHHREENEAKPPLNARFHGTSSWNVKDF